VKNIGGMALKRSAVMCAILCSEGTTEMALGGVELVAFSPLDDGSAPLLLIEM